MDASIIFEKEIEQTVNLLKGITTGISILDHFAGKCNKTLVLRVGTIPILLFLVSVIGAGT